MCSTCDSLQSASASPFAERMGQILNSGALSLMISLGHRAGLFDALAGREPLTSDELAQRADLRERYVREWLGAMVAGGVVVSEVGSGRFALPDEHAVCLTRAASPGNMAVSAQFLPMLAQVEDGILDCFRQGGGLPYESYPRFHDIMAEESRQTVVALLKDQVLPLVPGLTERLAEGLDVLDVGCGSGLAMIHLAEIYPLSRFTGYDASEEAVVRARDEARRRGLDNVRFELQDAAAMTDVERFDVVTALDSVHDQVAPAAVLTGIRRALRPGGVFLMQDIDAHSDPARNVDHPVGPLLYAISCMHCMTVSLAHDGAGLGAMWGVDTAARMLGEAGFTSQQVQRLPDDVMNAWTIARAD